MKKHTIIVGTSKSNNYNGYYFGALDKFWGLINKSGFNDKYGPCEYKKFTKDTGIGFDELVNKKIVSSDEELKQNLGFVQDGIKKFIKRQKNIKRIVFNGKNAAGWFYQYIEKKDKINKSGSSYFNKNNFKYGKQSKGYNDTEIWVMPNTSGISTYWKNDNGEKQWSKLWNTIAKEL